MSSHVFNQAGGVARTGHEYSKERTQMRILAIATFCLAGMFGCSEKTDKQTPHCIIVLDGNTQTINEAPVAKKDIGEIVRGYLRQRSAEERRSGKEEIIIPSPVSQISELAGQEHTVDVIIKLKDPSRITYAHLGDILVECIHGGGEFFWDWRV